jgi:hypothetical protein
MALTGGAVLRMRILFFKIDDAVALVVALMKRFRSIVMKHHAGNDYSELDVVRTMKDCHGFEGDRDRCK